MFYECFRWLFKKKKKPVIPVTTSPDGKDIYRIYIPPSPKYCNDMNCFTPDCSKH